MGQVIAFPQTRLAARMVELTAIRTGDKFSYRIAQGGESSATTTNREAAAELLRQLGVKGDTVELVQEAEQWHSVVVRAGSPPWASC